MALSHHAATGLKLIKLVFNIVVLVLYRNGDEGYFMGASYNKNHDAEALATGVFIGFMVYNIASLLSSCLDNQSVNRSVTESLMNLTGAVLWLITGAVVLQFWLRFIPSNHYSETNPSGAGISMGILCVINSAIYLADTVLAYTNYRALVEYDSENKRD